MLTVFYLYEKELHSVLTDIANEIIKKDESATFFRFSKVLFSDSENMEKFNDILYSDIHYVSYVSGLMIRKYAKIVYKNHPTFLDKINSFLNECQLITMSHTYSSDSTCRKMPLFVSQMTRPNGVYGFVEITQNIQRSVSQQDIDTVADYILAELKSNSKTSEPKNNIEIDEHLVLDSEKYTLAEILDTTTSFVFGDVFYNGLSNRYYMKTQFGIQNAVFENCKFEPTVDIVRLDKVLVTQKCFIPVKKIKKDILYYVNGATKQYLQPDSAEYLAGVLLNQADKNPNMALATLVKERNSFKDKQMLGEVMDILSKLILS